MNVVSKQENWLHHNILQQTSRSFFSPADADIDLFYKQVVKHEANLEASSLSVHMASSLLLAYQTAG
jgi:hypothetical protein